MLTAEQWGIITAVIAGLVALVIGWNVFVEVDAAIDRQRQKRIHRKNVEAWNRLFHCDADGLVQPDDTQVINLPKVRTPEEIGNDYAFALTVRYFHADEKEFTNA